MRKIMIAAKGTITITNANGIKSFNMSRVSSRHRSQQPQGQMAPFTFQPLSLAARDPDTVRNGQK
jgi:hypothetical protein